MPSTLRKKLVDALGFWRIPCKVHVAIFATLLIRINEQVAKDKGPGECVTLSTDMFEIKSHTVPPVLWEHRARAHEHNQFRPDSAWAVKRAFRSSMKSNSTRKLMS